MLIKEYFGSHHKEKVIQSSMRLYLNSVSGFKKVLQKVFERLPHGNQRIDEI